MITSKPILAIYNPKYPIHLYTDASQEQIGSILKQEQPDGLLKPIAYRSRRMTSYESNYCVTEQECLAIIDAVDFFLPYLDGVHFTIHTDHACLKYPIAHFVSDPELKQAQFDDNINDRKYTKFNGLLTIKKKGLIKSVVPPSLREKVLIRAHQDYGHIGVSKMLNLISPIYYWPYLIQDISNYVKHCEVCQLNKISHQKKFGLLESLPPAKDPFDLVSIDTVGGLNYYNSTKKFLHIIVDHATRYIWAFPSKSQTTDSYINCLNKIFQIQKPKQFLSDRAPSFTSPRFRKYLINNNIKQLLTSSSRPQCNGLNERLNQTIITRLRCKFNNLKGKSIPWTKLLDSVLNEYNNTPHSITGYTPTYLLYGKLPYDPPLKESEFYPPIDTARTNAYNNTLKFHQINKIRYDQHYQPSTFKVGDKVWLQTFYHPDNRKLMPPMSGPFTILKQISPVNYEIDKPQSNLGKTTMLTANLKKTTTIGDSRRTWRLLPSQLLRRLRQLVGESKAVSDTTLKMLWMQRLPPNIQIILTTEEQESLNSLADLADRVTELTSAPFSSTSTLERELASLRAGISALKIDHNKKEEHRWKDLTSLIGTNRIRTTAYNPAANGLVERLHRQIKAAIMTSGKAINWIDALPLVLLSIRTSYKEDLKCTTAEMKTSLKVSTILQFCHLCPTVMGKLHRRQVATPLAMDATRFINNLRSSTKVKGELSVKEIYEAELALLKLFQAECFPSHFIPGLKVYEVKGILRVKTKLFHSSDEFGFRLPVLLHGTHPTEYFLMALEKFIKRRGRPSTIFSDNGTNFVGANYFFKQIDWKRVSNEEKVKRIEWKFTPPTAAWWGGWWERLIRSLKDILKRMLGTSTLTYQQLMNLLCHAEAVINGRPVTYVSDDSNDLVTISPSMFLQEQTDVEFPECQIMGPNQTTQKLRYLNNMREELKSRFRKEYLSLLVQRNRRIYNPKLQAGDVVFVGMDKKCVTSGH
ncbi:hypothetical protein LAZ67_5002917 [Cordylochernes scorpioides]|uniref:RNA-directed DNA polymerase n=1 Tax=Cordylochernes scorpioides TaxID=51811 RepID=A0ABY6KGV2_9ARAC|nr:hypothetical protein LAZ67_5002917 [Cordylochernes scorpioides]